MLTNQNQKLKGDHEMLMIPHRGEASEAEVDKLGKCDQTQPHTQTHTDILALTYFAIQSMPHLIIGCGR